MSSIVFDMECQMNGAPSCLITILQLLMATSCISLLIPFSTPTLSQRVWSLRWAFRKMDLLNLGICTVTVEIIRGKIGVQPNNPNGERVWIMGLVGDKQMKPTKNSNVLFLRITKKIKYWQPFWYDSETNHSLIATEGKKMHQFLTRFAKTLQTDK